MSNSKPFGRPTAILLLRLVILLSTLPLALSRGGAFPGSDDAAAAAIGELAPGYQPWATPLFSPPSSSVETLLFTLQAALGAGLIGYFFGLKRGLRQAGRAAEPAPDDTAPVESQALYGHD